MVCRFFPFFFFQHYLCDPGIPLPKMEVTFSMQRLGRIEAECQHYMSEIQRMHRQRQEQRENEVNGRNSHRFFFFFFFSRLDLVKVRVKDTLIG